MTNHRDITDEEREFWEELYKANPMFFSKVDELVRHSPDFDTEVWEKLCRTKV